MDKQVLLNKVLQIAKELSSIEIRAIYAANMHRAGMALNDIENILREELAKEEGK